MLGYVTQFDRESRRGLVFSKECKGKIVFLPFMLNLGENVHVGDCVFFPQGEPDGTPQAVTVRIPAKTIQPKYTPIKEPEVPPPIFVRAKASAHLQKTKSRPSRQASDSSVCDECSKEMIPHLVICEGVPQRSFCPFCGTTHRDFRRPHKTTLADRGKTVAADVALQGVVAGIIFAIIGL